MPQSARLVFREFVAGDLDAFAALLADPQVMRYSWQGPRGRRESADVLKAFQRGYRQGGIGKWALELKASGEFVGYCGFEKCPPGAPEGYELGYRFRPEFWGQGIASEAAGACVKHAFTALNLPHIIAFIEPANAASLRVLEKCGFQRIAQDAQLNGKTMDIYRLDPPKKEGRF